MLFSIYASERTYREIRDYLFLHLDEVIKEMNRTPWDGDRSRKVGTVRRATKKRLTKDQFDRLRSEYENKLREAPYDPRQINGDLVQQVGEESGFVFVCTVTIDLGA